MSLEALKRLAESSVNKSNTNKDLLLMCKDVEVLRINFDNSVYDVINESLLPWGLKNKLYAPYPEKSSYSKYDMTQIMRISKNNQEMVIHWLANRILTLSRANSKWIYNLLKFEQVQSDYQKAKIAIVCRAVSLQDSYWLKLDGDNTNWAGVDIRRNHLNEVIAQVALHGKSLTLCGSLISPELTTHGAYAKAWRRHEDGSLWLYKLGHNGNTESRIEVMCSNLLDKMNVEHIHYESGEDEGKYVCMCPCMTTEDIAMLSGMEFYSYCCSNNLDSEKEAIRIDADSIYKMWIVDYLIANRDRHGQNWGFYYNVNTMEIIGCHPLFDHNNAFDLEYMKDENASYQFGNMTTKEAAMYAMKKVDFHFTSEITRSDFITDRQYEVFMKRANQLGIVTKVN